MFTFRDHDCCLNKGKPRLHAVNRNEPYKSRKCKENSIVPSGNWSAQRRRPALFCLRKSREGGGSCRRRQMFGRKEHPEETLARICFWRNENQESLSHCDSVFFGARVCKTPTSAPLLPGVCSLGNPASWWLEKIRLRRESALPETEWGTHRPSGRVHCSAPDRRFSPPPATHQHPVSELQALSSGANRLCPCTPGRSQTLEK